MSEKPRIWTPQMYFTLYKIIGILLLCMLWVIEGNGLEGLYLLLSISILMLLRWRFPKHTWTLLLDLIIVFILSAKCQLGVYVLILCVFEAMFLGSSIFIIPILIYSIITELELSFYLMLLQGAFAGYCLWGWKKHRITALNRLDQDNRRYYELENMKQELLVANKQTASLAELTERSRIARDIHDHAGHEIIAAYMSLQTAQLYFREEPIQSEELLNEAMVRLESGIEKIRETVQNLTPLSNLGIENMQRLCKEFQYCPIELKIYGDSSKVPVYLWTILEPCLKEALTNIIRHSSARKVTASLDITPSIVRLCVENDGVGRSQTRNSGVGLYNLQQRAAAVGGNVSTSLTDVFRLVCVLSI